MSLNADLYYAQKAANVPDDLARKAAASVRSLDKIESYVSSVKWMVRVNLTLTVLVLGRLVLLPG